MATVSAGLVKDLREKTGAGMMDCKKALDEAKGDMEAAVDWLSKHPRAHELWCTVEERITQAVRARLQGVDRVETRLFGLHGVALGHAA